MRKKRIGALALALSLALSVGGITTAFAASSQTSLETIRALGIMVGDENGNLNLSSSVTRAQFVTMMTAASSFKDSIGTGSNVSLFKDVKSGYWGSEYIKLAVSQSWMLGYVDGTFHPDSTITLEEACTALLRLLGYDSSTLTGSYPSAQMTKASSVGLLDDVTAVQGQTLTRQDCVTLFYNLLICNTSSGMAYGSTLGYTVKNGEVDYASLVTSDTKGPFVAESAGSLSLPFSASSATVYRDGSLSSLTAVTANDVYYYNANLRIVWVYSDRVTGTLTALSPNRTAPSAATVGGVTYEIGTSTATYKLSSQGQFTTGETVTLLLGMNGEIVDVLSPGDSESMYYGVVVSSAKSASSSSTSTSDTSSVQVTTQVACSDGTVRTFYHTGAALSSGRLVSVSVTQSGTTVKTITGKSLSGSVNSTATSFAGYLFADNVEILDTDSYGNYVKLYPSRLAGAKLTSSEVRYYTLDANGAIDRLILSDATGDTYTYAYVTKASSNDSGMSVSGSYQYLVNGMSQSYNSNNSAFSVTTGGAILIYDGGTLKSMRQLSSVTLDDLSLTYAMSGSKKYLLDDSVQVILREGSNYYATTLSQINSTDYTLKGWYDSMNCPAGGRIRIIVATAN